VYAQTRQRPSRHYRGKAGEVVWIDDSPGIFGHRHCLEARRCWLPTDYPAIQRWLDGHLEADIAARADPGISIDTVLPVCYNKYIRIKDTERKHETMKTTIASNINPAISVSKEVYSSTYYTFYLNNKAMLEIIFGEYGSTFVNWAADAPQVWQDNFDMDQAWPYINEYNLRAMA
jgi:hypothetical protein